VVSADLADFRDMASDENMAVSFYKTGDPEDLAAQIIALLDSPEAQRRAAEQNYSSAIRMTMPHVVRHYLRWFELERRKKRFDGLGRNRFLNRWYARVFRPTTYALTPDTLADWSLRGAFSEEEAATEKTRPPA
jgi:hypothetical protein